MSKMNRGVLSVILLCIAVAVGFLVGRQTYRKQFAVMRFGSFTVLLDALQDFRQGNTEAGIEKIEHHCFAGARDAASSGYFKEDRTFVELEMELNRYREERREAQERSGEHRSTVGAQGQPLTIDK